MTILPPGNNNNKPNNFDLIRLVASIVVLFFHGLTSFFPSSSISYQIGIAIYQMMPAVPIFFVVSGFLITHSILKNHSILTYAKARFLRIYPAFVLSTLITSGLLYAFGYWNFTWFINQFTVIWLYSTPQVTVPFGGGMPNGSLWTIPVEVQFYLVLPFLLKTNKPTFWVITLMALSVVLQLNHDFGHYHHPDLRHGAFHHFWFFGWGALGRLHYNRIKGHPLAWLMAHLALCAVLVGFIPTGGFIALGGLTFYNIAGLNLLLGLTLPGLILSTAFAGNYKLKNDLSYGLYLFQIPYIHALTACGLTGWIGACLLGVLTWGSAYLSWELVEKPCLRLK